LERADKEVYEGKEEGEIYRSSCDWLYDCYAERQEPYNPSTWIVERLQLFLIYLFFDSCNMQS
jgi:hypothetical protein